MISEKKYNDLYNKYQLLKDDFKKIEKENERIVKHSQNEEIRIHKFSRSLILKQEESRKAISRELHDEIAQILTGINYELEVLSKEASKSEKRVRDKIVKAQEMIIGSVDIIHRFARDLRPIVLDDLGLGAALQSCIKEFHKRNKTVVKLNANLKGLKLDDFCKTTLFRVAQEALNNIEKHAKAKSASINIKVDKKNLTMTIMDDGISFITKRTKNLHNKIGIGILGMQDRIKMLDGSLAIHSSKKIGTHIEIKVPLSHLNKSNK